MRNMTTDLALHDITSPFAAFRPPKRVTVAQGAAESLYIRQPGGYTGFWSADETPYMVEPMNELASRIHEAVCFAGPARSGKTMALLDAWLAHCATCDPGDMLMVQMTQDKAREFSKTRIDRAIRYSPVLAALMSSRSNDDNTHDKLFKNGMWLKIAWPTVSQLSSSDYRYVALTDYDRMPDDVDGEGSAFQLGLKRTTTFLSRGMCSVESSPGRPVIDPKWKPATEHEAPPVGGILGIYNRSDRRRWYWQCPDCSDYFEAKPGLALFNLPSDDILLEMVRTADIDELAKQYSNIVCPCCGVVIDKTNKHTMNKGGKWVGDGQTIDSNGVVHGKIMSSSIAGYWLGGVAAAYQSWQSLVARYLQGLREYALSGSELTLQVTANTDQGIPYTSRLLLESVQNAGDPYSRREKLLSRFIVPPEARFLVAAVDVQGGSNARFVVQVHAVGPHMEQWLVDRFNIELSEREGMGSEFAPLDPASYQEDWETLTKLVVNATYRLEEDGRELRIKMIAVDTGGEHKKKGVGVSEKAYKWYRGLRAKGLHGRVMLVKGASTPKAPLFRQTMVGAQIKGQEGDIPLFMINTNILKDQVSTSLKRQLPGPGYMHFPDWLATSFYDELAAEVRNTNGTWMQVKKRNEAFDLSGYVRAVCLRLGVDKITDWDHPPTWAATLDKNSDVITADQRRQVQSESSAKPASRAKRRVGGSRYMG
jgi:phage terminase large subunit GpA-like protein